MKLLVYVFVFALFIPELFKTSVPILYWLLEAVRIGGSLFYIIRYIRFEEKSTIFNCTLLFHLVILISSIINGADFDTYKTIVNVTFPNLAVICFLEIKTKDNCIEGINVIRKGLQILVLCNFIFMILHPGGVFVSDVWSSETTYVRTVTSYLLSFKNRLILWFLPLMILLTRGANKRVYFFYNFIMLLQLIISESVTSIFVFFLFHVLYILYKYKFEKKINIKVYYVVFILLFFFLVFFQVQNFFESFITNNLGKNMELQGRVFIWAYAVELIKNNWILGYGNSGNGSIIDWNGFMWYSHNLILDILIQGGAFALSVIGFLFYKISRIPIFDKDYLVWLNTVYAAIIALLLEGTFESFLNYPQFFLILGLASCFYLNTDGRYEYIKKL